ncbi:hypothetical protein [Cobetia sp. 1CM21F]|uniref:hypothetical protein n=1 Tax=Cobetia sp. 1CM21F TaxID=2929163 RepID=UPI0020C18333|nr:hypothetical protein [Cobetia sp. 1CM21F]MCK8066412.1 hypothetical protein [Cobetia sp. 1CM21F]
MLAIVDTENKQFDPLAYSIYSKARLQELWLQGNPFAWHLYLESKLIFSRDGIDFVSSMGAPKKYSHGIQDCKKFYDIFLKAKEELLGSGFSETFDLSTIFLSIRNFATCYSLQYSSIPCFSRDSALNIGCQSLCMDYDAYEIFKRARILCTRGVGDPLTVAEVDVAKKHLEKISGWMESILGVLCK